MRLLNVLLALTLSYASGVSADAAPAAADEAFTEHLTIRPLHDGRLSTNFQFTLTSTPSPTAPSHFRLLPRSLLHVLQAGRATELSLALHAGQWDYARWGFPVDEEEQLGTGAELWARVGSDDESSTNATQAGIPSASALHSWQRLTASLAGLFCTSLNALDGSSTVKPELLPQPPASISSPRATSYSNTTLLHAFLPSENVCTENLTPLLSLLPCRSSSGLANLLEPHKLFATDFHGITVHARRVGSSEEQAGWELKLGVQAVFSPVLGLEAGMRNWSLEKLFGRTVQRSCPLASSSVIRVMAPTDEPHSIAALFDEEEEVSPPTYVLYPKTKQQLQADKEADEPSPKLGVTLRKQGSYEFDARNPKETYDDQTGLNVVMKWTEEALFSYPRSIRPPSLVATRSLLGAGQERGKLQVRIRNAEKTHSREVLYYELLPWFIKPQLHTLSMNVELDDYDEEEDNVVRYVDDARTSPLLNLSYSPSIARTRPFRLEALLRVPPSSTLTLEMRYDKAFLRYEEHPPDAHRGFDVAPAVLLHLEDGAQGRGVKRIYTSPGLVELAVPDFSMPYNVIIFSSTLIALCAGSALNNLIRRYTDRVMPAPVETSVKR